MNDLQDIQKFSADNFSWLPDLYVYTGSGWEDGIVVSNTKDGESVYTLTTDDTIYISFAVVNYGEANADSFAGMFLIDNEPVYSLECNNGLKNRSYTIARNVYIGNLAAGRHILTVKSDYYNSVEESNELNNDYSFIIKVMQGETTPGSYLLNTRWDQSGNGKAAYKFNKYVPDDGHTGCTNTAITQIVYYWIEQGYDLQLQVTPDDYMLRITDGGTETINAGNLQDRCGITLEGLNEIIDIITCEAPNWDDDNDIAALTLASMLISNSEIGDSSTATIKFAETELLERAGFNFDCVNCQTEDSIPWERIQANIADDRPVLAGVKSIMHTLVIDGYNAVTNEYHLNFGWGFEGFKSDKKYNFETGTGWYSTDEMAALKFTSLVLDVYPNYDIDDPTKKPMMIVDWSDKITPEMSIDNGFYVTISISSQLISMNIPQKGANVFMSTKNATLTSECMDGTPVLQMQKLQAAFDKDADPLLLRGMDNGLTDVFFARVTDTWEGSYLALHSGDDSGWKGTGEYVFINGKNRISDIFIGTGTSAILRLTDDACGDALFADDIFTASYDNIAEEQARVDCLHEIIAGAGDDIVDLTSARFSVKVNDLTIHGNGGDDIIWGNSNQNTLFGDAGNDRLVGGPANDVIIGGIGDDDMAGEGGEDIFCFCSNWGTDLVYQKEDGKVTLWFAEGSMDYWDAANLTYSFDGNSVCVDGVSNDSIALKFGDDGSALYGNLRASGAFYNGMIA